MRPLAKVCSTRYALPHFAILVRHFPSARGRQPSAAHTAKKDIPHKCKSFLWSRTRGLLFRASRLTHRRVVTPNQYCQLKYMNRFLAFEKRFLFRFTNIHRSCTSYITLPLSEWSHHQPSMVFGFSQPFIYDVILANYTNYSRRCDEVRCFIFWFKNIAHWSWIHCNRHSVESQESVKQKFYFSDISDLSGQDDHLWHSRSCLVPFPSFSCCSKSYPAFTPVTRDPCPPSCLVCASTGTSSWLFQRLSSRSHALEKCTTNSRPSVNFHWRPSVD